MKHVMTPYSATVAVAVASVTSGLQMGLLAIPAGIMYFFISRYCLTLMIGKTKEEDPYKKGAEQIAVFGMMIFLPLIFTLGILAALLVFVVFAQLALNLQTFGKRQYYLGLMLSFTLITFSASQSRDGGFILYFIPYSLLLCAALFSLSVEHFKMRLSLWLKSSSLLLVCTLVVYLIMPRFPALLFGATPGSDYFYHDKVWLEKAKTSEQEFSDDTLTDSTYAEAATNMAQDMVDEMSQKHSQSSELSEALQQLKHSLGELEGAGGDNQMGFKSEYSEQGEQESLGIDNSPRLNPNIVMHVRSDVPLYLSTKILDTFDGLRWSQSMSSKTYVEENKNGFIDPHNHNKIITAGYEVEVIENLSGSIPMAWQPVVLDFPASALTVDEYGSFRVPDKLKKGTAYRGAMSHHWHMGRPVYPVNESNLYRYLSLPNQLDVRIVQLAQEVVGDSKTSWEKAHNLEQHLREHYAYTLDTVIESQGKTPLSEFLFETRYGHCEFFASAMALMLRTQGIPSRVVNGYAATDQNPLTGFIEVRGTDAHAWTEAYHEGFGWVPYEPTSYYQLPQEQTEQTLTYEKVNEYVERQLDILEQQQVQWSLSKMLLQFWQSLVMAVSVLLLSLKWVAVTFGVYIIAALVALAVVWMIYRQLKPTWLEYQLKKNVAAYELRGTLHDYEFYFDAIKTSLRLQNKAHQFSTAADFMTLLQELNLPNWHNQDVNAFLSQFNQSAYGHVAKVDAEQLAWLKRIFEGIWQHRSKGG